MENNYLPLVVRQGSKSAAKIDFGGVVAVRWLKPHFFSFDRYSSSLRSVVIQEFVADTVS